MQNLATGSSPLGRPSSPSPRRASRTRFPRGCGSSSKPGPDRSLRRWALALGFALIPAVSVSANAQPNRPAPVAAAAAPALLSDADVRLYGRLLAMNDTRRIDDALILEG